MKNPQKIKPASLISPQTRSSGKSWSQKPVHEYPEIALVKFANNKVFDLFTRGWAISPDLRDCPYNVIGWLLMVVPRDAIKYFDSPDVPPLIQMLKRPEGSTKEEEKAFEVIKVVFVPKIPRAVIEHLNLLNNLADRSKERVALPDHDELNAEEGALKTPYIMHVNKEGEKIPLRNYVLDEVAHKAAFDALVLHEEDLAARRTAAT